MMWKYTVTILTVLCSLWTITNISKIGLISSTSIQLNIIDGNRIIAKTVTSTLTAMQNNMIKRKIKHHVPKFMLELYERSKIIGFDGDRVRPDVVRSMIPKIEGYLHDEEAIQNVWANHMLIFDIPASNEDEKFLGAELKVLTLVKADLFLLSALERVVKVNVYDHAATELLHSQALHISHTNNTWITFNLTTAVHSLLLKARENRVLKILISIHSFLPYVENLSSSFKLSLMPVAEDFQHDYPVLLLSYTSTREEKNAVANKRKKRNVEEDYEEETNRVWDNEPQNLAKARRIRRIKNTCRRKPLYIDFAEIEYDTWIVQPTGYEAYQCTGKCFYPVAEHLSPTKHAIVQALLHSVAPSRAPRSCCVPTKLDAISVLYVDNKGVLTYRFSYKDMVVSECGCR